MAVPEPKTSCMADFPPVCSFLTNIIPPSMTAPLAQLAPPLYFRYLTCELAIFGAGGAGAEASGEGASTSLAAETLLSLLGRGSELR